MTSTQVMATDSDIDGFNKGGNIDRRFSSKEDRSHITLALVIPFQKGGGVLGFMKEELSTQEVI